MHALKSNTTSLILGFLKQKQGEYISGEHICQILGISRCAVWKHVTKLKKMGYEIDAKHNCGYLLHHSVDPFNYYEMQEALDKKKFGQTIYFFKTVESTNKFATNIALKGGKEGEIIVTNAQSKGKGRLGRIWESPPDKNIYISIILRPDILPNDAPKLTLVAAVALAETLHNTLNLPVEIKWPNDILYKGRKLAGILTELSSEIDRVNFVILGIGINVNWAKEDFPQDLRKKVTSLLEITGRIQKRVIIVKNLLESLEKWYNLFLSKGFTPIAEKWNKYANIKGRRAEITLLNKKITGKILQIDTDGALLLETKNKKIERIVAGDVTFLS